MCYNAVARLECENLIFFFSVSPLQYLSCLTEIKKGRTGRDRIVVSTSRCGRDNPGSNPGHGITTIAKSLVLYYTASSRMLE